MAEMNFASAVEDVDGIGPKTAEALLKYGIRSVKDLLYYFPRTYENYCNATKISDLTPGKVIVKGKIKNLQTISTKRRNFTITTGEIYDDTDAVKVIWYNQPYRAKSYDENRVYYFTGEYGLKFRTYQISSPSSTLAEEAGSGFQPIYSAKGSHKSIWFKKIFEKLRPYFTFIPDLLPDTKIGARGDALFNIHFPESIEDVEKAKQYLGYEELFELILAAKLNKMENQKLDALSLKFDVDTVKELLNTLPFELTDGQRKATWDILKDLEKTVPMNRLLQGDVGSGKTVVAAIAAYQVVKDGSQVALLAPTAILATQHYESFKKLLGPLGVNVELLIGSTKNKNAVKEHIRTGHANIIIGTHAILTDDTIFHSLAFCIIDEQHRFGVMQRQKLLEKVQKNTDVNSRKVAMAPHFLAMSATPIPRSLQLTVFGDLDVSIISELPKGRQEIKTKILNEINMKDDLYPIVKQHLENKEQVYWICRFVEESHTSDQADVKREAKRLEKIFPNYRIDFLHGKMKPDEKDQKMKDFKDGNIDILVSTTVVEVGVDVPNATQIIILDAESYGLAQLHQLRGRVGRGKKQSDCYLIVAGDAKPSRRLLELEKTTDGFHLAEVDLKIRGPGQIYGTMQHGELNLKVASLTDTVLIAKAQESVSRFVENPENMLEYKELMGDIRQYQQITTLN